jgi:hypothetical protein
MAKKAPSAAMTRNFKISYPKALAAIIARFAATGIGDINVTPSRAGIS